MLFGNNSTITNAITHTDNCATNNNKHITILVPLHCICFIKVNLSKVDFDDDCLKKYKED